MKKVILLPIMALLTICLSSCTSSKSVFSVKGEQGTQIFTPDQKYLGTIDANGETQIELDRSAKVPFCTYLLAQKQGERPIPFALDYHNIYLSRTVIALDFVAMGVSLVGSGISLIGLKFGGEALSMTGIKMLVGGGAFALFVAPPLIGGAQFPDTRHNKIQQSNQDMFNGHILKF